MEISLKQRLIGAAVLIALAVIFLPMFLDGAGRREQLQMEMEIPPEPKFSFKYQQPPPPEPVTLRPEAMPPPSSTELRRAEPEAGSVPESGGVDRARPGAADSTARRPSPAKVRTSKAPATEATRAPESTKRSGWVVQAGSFSRETNARALRRRLEKDGFSAFVEQYRAGGGSPAYRVKLGPVDSKAKANALKARLKGREGIDGIVMSYGPKRP